MDLISLSTDFLEDPDHYWIFLVAINLDIFRTLFKRNLSYQELAIKIRVAPERLRPILMVLVAKGFLEWTNDGCFRTRTVKVVFKEIESLISDYCNKADRTINDITYPYISVLQKDQPIQVAAAGGDVTAEKREEFQKRIELESLEMAAEVATLLSGVPVSKIADIGCGAGTYSFALLERNKTATAHL